MKITRIIFLPKENINKNALAVCSVIVDDCFMLSNICLFKNENYFLTYPSKQDIYKSIKDLNEGVSIVYPVNSKGGEGNKSFEEYFHPLSKECYDYMLDVILKGYNEYLKCNNKKTSFSYRINNK